VQVLSLLALSGVVYDNADPKAMTICLVISSFAYGIVDCVVDGLWVTQVRCDAKYGSNDLMAFSLLCLSVGGIFSSGSYAYLGYLSLYWTVYLIPLVASLLMMISACFISKDIDGDCQLILDMDLSSRFRFTLRQVKLGLQQK
jgi:hypothetical protein